MPVPPEYGRQIFGSEALISHEVLVGEGHGHVGIALGEESGLPVHDSARQTTQSDGLITLYEFGPPRVRSERQHDEVPLKCGYAPDCRRKRQNVLVTDLLIGYRSVDSKVSLGNHACAMSECSDKAVASFAQCNCSQAVLSAFGPDLGLSAADCMRVAACFGAGMGRLGKTCGALTGAFIVLGLRHAKEMQDNPQLGRDAVYGRVQSLTARFEAEHGSSECRSLTECDLMSSAGRQQFAERGLHHTLCDRLVKRTVEMLEEQ